MALGLFFLGSVCFNVFFLFGQNVLTSHQKRWTCRSILTKIFAKCNFWWQERPMAAAAQDGDEELCSIYAHCKSQHRLSIAVLSANQSVLMLCFWDMEEYPHHERNKQYPQAKFEQNFDESSSLCVTKFLVCLVFSTAWRIYGCKNCTLATENKIQAMEVPAKCGWCCKLYTFRGDWQNLAEKKQAILVGRENLGDELRLTGFLFCVANTGHWTSSILTRSHGCK